jgi:hypothetical protein
MDSNLPEEDFWLEIDIPRSRCEILIGRCQVSDRWDAMRRIVYRVLQPCLSTEYSSHHHCL